MIINHEEFVNEIYTLINSYSYNMNISRKIVDNIINSLYISNSGEYLNQAKDILNHVILDDKYTLKQKYHALNIIKEIFAKSGFNNDIAVVFADHDIFGLFKSFILKYDKSKELNENEPRSVYDNLYYVLLCKCIQEWGIIFNTTNNDKLEIYGKVYRDLLNQGIQFGNNSIINSNSNVDNLAYISDHKCNSPKHYPLDNQDNEMNIIKDDKSAEILKKPQKNKQDKSPNQSGNLTFSNENTWIYNQESNCNLTEIKTNDTRIEGTDSKSNHTNQANLNLSLQNSNSCKEFNHNDIAQQNIKEAKLVVLTEKEDMEDFPITVNNLKTPNFQFNFLPIGDPIKRAISYTLKQNTLANDSREIIGVELPEVNTFSQTIGIHNYSNLKGPIHHDLENHIQSVSNNDIFQQNDPNFAYKNHITNTINNSSEITLDNTNQLKVEPLKSKTNYQVPLSTSQKSEDNHTNSSISAKRSHQINGTEIVAGSDEKILDHKYQLQYLFEQTLDDEEFDFDKYQEEVARYTSIDNNNNNNLLSSLRNITMPDNHKNPERNWLSIQKQHPNDDYREPLIKDITNEINLDKAYQDSSLKQTVPSKDHTQSMPKSNNYGKSYIPHSRYTSSNYYDEAIPPLKDQINPDKEASYKIEINHWNKIHIKPIHPSNNSILLSNRVPTDDRNLRQTTTDTDRPSTIPENSASFFDSSFTKDMFQSLKSPVNDSLKRKLTFALSTSPDRSGKMSEMIVTPKEEHDILALMNENRNLRMENLNLKFEIDELNMNLKDLYKLYEDRNNHEIGNLKEEIQKLRLENERYQQENERYQQENQIFMKNKVEQEQHNTLMKNKMKELSTLSRQCESQDNQEKQTEIGKSLDESERLKRDSRFEDNDLYNSIVKEYELSVQKNQELREKMNSMIKSLKGLYSNLNELSLNEIITKFQGFLALLNQENSMLLELLEINEGLSKDKSGLQAQSQIQKKLNPTETDYDSAISLHLNNECYTSPMKINTKQSLEISSVACQKSKKRLSYTPNTTSEYNRIEKTQIKRRNSYLNQEKPANYKTNISHSSSKTEYFNTSTKTTTYVSDRAYIPVNHISNGVNDKATKLSETESKSTPQRIGTFLRKCLLAESSPIFPAVRIYDYENICSISQNRDPRLKMKIHDSNKSNMKCTPTHENCLNRSPGIIERNHNSNDQIFVKEYQENMNLNSILSIDFVIKEEGDDIRISITFKNKKKKDIENFKFTFAQHTLGYRIVTGSNAVMHQPIIRPDESQEHEFIGSLIGNQYEIPKMIVSYTYCIQKYQFAVNLPLSIINFIRFSENNQFMNKEDFESYNSNKHMISSKEISLNIQQFTEKESIFAKMIHIQDQQYQNQTLSNSSRLIGEFKLGSYTSLFFLDVIINDILRSKAEIKLYYEKEMEQYAINILNTIVSFYKKIEI